MSDCTTSQCDALTAAALTHVAFDGWSMAARARCEGYRDGCGGPADVFPDGVADAIWNFSVLLINTCSSKWRAQISMNCASTNASHGR